MNTEDGNKPATVFLQLRKYVHNKHTYIPTIDPSSVSVLPVHGEAKEVPLELELQLSAALH